MLDPYFVRWLIVLSPLLLSACQSDSSSHQIVKSAANDTLAFYDYIERGDSVYAQKRGYSSFARSLPYYDSAQALADQSGDSLLLAEAIFAKGRVYDAWNKQPQKTIYYFAWAARLFHGIPGQYKRYIYTRHLVAHAYDKIKDSLHTVSILNQLYYELSQKDTALLRQMPCIAEMALIATEVQAYALAEQIIHRLTRRAWIYNDPNRYDYLNHYYLTQSRLDAFQRRPEHSFYLDSLQAVCDKSVNLMDKLYYSESLAPLYAAMGQYQPAARYYGRVKKLSDSLNNQTEFSSMQEALLQSELLAEKHKIDYQRSINTIRTSSFWVLGSLLILISGLSLALYQRNKRFSKQSQRLSIVNQQLDEKVTQVELLNKEIQHRVKNNLHMIYSLLQMQERKADNPQTVAALQVARLRIESIANLHQQLLAGRGNLDMSAYLKSLVSSVVNCLTEERKLITNITVEADSLPVSSYLPLALVLNEWVTNSIKYAQTNDHALEINVEVNAQANHVCIDYSDNGLVLSMETPAGLGLQIVSMLSRQMNARLTTHALSPYHYRLCVPHGR